MKRILFILSFCLIFSTLHGQNLEWAKRLGVTYYDSPHCIEVDASGNSYLIGRWNSGNGSNAENIIIIKQDVSGNTVWSKIFAATADAYGASIAVDVFGNVYTTGYFESTVDFDPGTGTENLTSVGVRDIFVSKLDPSGNFLWVKQIGSTDYEEGMSIDIDPNGNILTTGYFFGNLDFDPGLGVLNLLSGGSFISKLDPSGNFVWAKQFSGSAMANSIKIDDLGNIYTTGRFSEGSAVDFDPGVGTYNLSTLDNDAFICKLDAAGDFLWAKQIEGVGFVEGISIAIDNVGNVFSTGFFNGSSDFDPSAATFNLTSAGGDDFYISKLDASGDFLWAKSIGGTGEDRAKSIGVDAQGNCYLTGYFEGTVDFDPGISSYTPISIWGTKDVFTLKLDGSGEFSWMAWIAANGEEFSNSLAIDPTGYVLITGTFAGTVDFDPGAGTFNLTASGSQDIFALKLTLDAPTAPELIVGSTMSSFSQTLGSQSAEQSFTVSGSNLSNNITISAPTNYEVSLSSGSGFASSVQVTQTSGTVPNTEIYVRLNAGAIGAHNGDITLTSGTLTETVAVTGNTNEGTSSLNENNLTQLSIFPNPGSGVITLSVSQPTTVLFIGTNGAIHANLELNAESTFDVSNFAPGVYFIRTAEGQTVKFVKE